ncbi:MAG: glycosyltransferase family 39 protein, partial [Candidatus Krumholzibacteriota bacterium]|nr:glycosyltransferase family 39 protein [Candidatus Krumholzibacteriota bacterium]
MTIGARHRRTGLLFAAILLVAVILRIVFFVELSRSPLGDIEPLDVRFYRETAAAMASGNGFPAGPLTFNPLYPVLLSVLFRLFGAGFLAARILNAAFGVLTIALVFFAARQLAGGAAGGETNGGDASAARAGTGRADAAGLVAAAAAVLYPQFVLYEGSLLATSAVTFLFAAAFCLALGIDEVLGGGLAGGRTPGDGPAATQTPGRLRIGRRSVSLRGAIFLLGIVAGLGVLGRPNLFGLLLPLLAARFLFLAAQTGAAGGHDAAAGGARKAAAMNWKAGAAAAALLVAGAILPAIPAAIHNARAGGPPLPLPAHGGINLYIGNRPGGTGAFEPPEGMRADMRGLVADARQIASREAGRELSDAEASVFWSARARDVIAAD